MNTAGRLARCFSGLPVLFICENNLYSVYSPLAVRQPPGRAIDEVVSALGCTSGRGDGNEALEVYEKTSAALRSIRAGEGPRFLEFATYRWREHCGPNYDNDLGYRSTEEFAAWKKRDPVRLLERRLLEASALAPEGLAALEKEMHGRVEEAFAFAERSPFPAPEDLSAHVYADA